MHKIACPSLRKSSFNGLGLVLWGTLLGAATAQPVQTRSNDHLSKASKTNAWHEFGSSREWRVNNKFADAPLHLQRNWKISVGEGRSQIVADNGVLYIASGSSTKSEDKETTQVTTTLSAVRQIDGSPIWTFLHSATLHEGQQTFGGAQALPQATPLLAGESLVLLTFTGELICVNAKSGKETWKKDLVESFGAEPVQFGFAASPVRCPNDARCFLVLAAGPKGGLVNLSLVDGIVNWTCPIRTFSYATPLATSLAGIKQWLVVSQDDLLGIDQSNGQILWNYPLPSKGLTNVPAALAVNDSQIVVAGQGLDGARCLEIKRLDQTWKVEERWASRRLNYFYTNWVSPNPQIAMGCNEGFLAAFSIADGSILGKWRGFGDGNMLISGDHCFILNGKGELAILRQEFDKQSLVETARFKVAAGRCWTAPTFVGGNILVRCKDELLSYTLGPNSSGRDETNLLAETGEKRLEWTAVAKVEVVQEILDTFDQQGQAAALQLYSQKREAGQLSASDRISLATAAYQNGMHDLAEMIMQHAKEDMPESAAIQSQLRSMGGPQAP